MKKVCKPHTMKTLSYFNEKCGEITFCTQMGKRIYALNCLYCSQIGLQWDIFIKHLEEEHDNDFKFDPALQLANNEIEFQMNREVDESQETITPIYNKVDESDPSAFDDDPLENENSTNEKCLESFIKIEKEECAPNLTMFDNGNNSEYERMEIEENNSKFAFSMDRGTLYQNYVTNNQEDLNTNFVKISDLINFRREFKEELQNTEIRIRNEIKEMTETINEDLLPVLKLLRLNKTEDIIVLSAKPDIIPEQPFCAIEDFLKYESAIRKDKAKYNQLISELEQQNASCFRSYVKLIWKTILSDSAAQHMCWNGSEKKKPVNSLTVTQALKAACLKKYPVEEDLSFEKISMHHFQHAKDRYDKKVNYKNKVRSAIK